MSVAALTVQKRPWCDEMQMDYSPTCRGQQKRLCFGMASPQVHQQQAPASPLFHKEPARQTYSNPNSPFNRSIPHEPVEKYMDGKTLKRARLRYREEQENSSSPYFRLPSPKKPEHEILFTMDQVKSIVSRALEEREATLRQHYDALLEEKLAEQYNSFARFNEDNIHRRMTESTFNYML